MKYHLLGLALLGAASSPAFAQDAASSGFYVQLNTGIATLDDPTLRITDGADTLDTTLKTKDAWGVGGQLGYKVGGLRLGLDLRYQRNKVKGIRFDGVNGTAITAADAEDIADLLVEEELIDPTGLQLDGTTVRATSGSVAKLRQVGVMANATYEFDLGAFKPYVGGGLGAVGTHVNAYDFDDGTIRFAWQLKAGAAFQVSPHFALLAEYTYRQANAGRLQFGDEEDFEYRLGKTKSSYFAVGARFGF